MSETMPRWHRELEIFCREVGVGVDEIKTIY